MKGLENLLKLINDNWATVVTICALLFGIYSKAKTSYKEWQAKTEAEKQAQIKEAQEKAIAAAKSALGNEILKLVAKAEDDWNDKGSQLGEIKRAQVINEIYKQYPILATVSDQQELLDYIDNLIKEALVTVREKIRKEMDK